MKQLALSLRFIDKQSIRIGSFIAVLILCVIYFVQITSVSARGAEIKRLSEQKKQLTGETYRIELNIAENASAQNLQKRVTELGLKAADNVQYLQVGDGSVAIK